MENTDLSHVPAIKWGIDHEDDARQDLEMSQLHEGFQYATAGSSLSICDQILEIALYI